MTKAEFFEELEALIRDLPSEQTQERLNFLSEMIDDAMEDGLSQQQSVAAVGSPSEVAAQIISEIPLSKIVKEKVKPERQLKAWKKALLVLGFPVWFPVTAAVLAVIFSVYISLWAVIISLWVVFVSFAAGALGGMALGIYNMISGNLFPGAAAAGAALALSGLSLFMLVVCKAVTKAFLRLTKKFILSIKKRLVRKEKSK